MRKKVVISIVLLTIVMLILSSACAPEDTTTPATTQSEENTGTVAPINSQTVTSTPTLTSPVTPDSTSTPTSLNYDEMIFIPTEEELSRIEEAAKQYREQLIDMYAVTSRKLDLTTDLNYIISSIRWILCDFDVIYKWKFDPNDEIDVAETRRAVFSHYMTPPINGYYLIFLDNYTNSFMEDVIFTPTYLDISAYYKLADNYQIYTGLDLLEAEEYLFKDMCESLDDDRDVFTQKAIIYQSFVEDFYLNQDRNISYNGDTLSSFQDAHPSVKVVLLYNAYSQLKIICNRAIWKDKASIAQLRYGELRYSVVDLINTIHSDITYDELLPLLEAYIARVESGN